MQSDENERIRRLIGVDKTSLPPDGGARYNRLIFATSPYLLQHAENPVDWYEWGVDAFAAARSENKPVFLSVGYATCHWCHVMAHESFEDGEVAALLNEHFIPVKVDREERPDIDSQYMTVAQMMTGSGGWPLTVVMSPDREPFFAATYLPRTPRMGMPGIITVLNRIAQFWRMEPDRVAENCASIMESLNRFHRGTSRPVVATDLEKTALDQLESMYDNRWGGFGQAPKFPMPFNLSFLLRCWKRSRSPSHLDKVTTTLRSMRFGGIFDQIGFGFHRYSVDREWLVPHFEKMLYDQALLALAYLEAFQATEDPFFRRVAAETFSFVLRELTSGEGGFHAALDADSEGEEGKFYVWTPAEVKDLLGEQDGEKFCRLFDISERGNFEGRSIPHYSGAGDDWPGGALHGVAGLEMEQWRERLLAVRERRIRPFRDEKVVTAWCGMMIAAMAKGYAVCGEMPYLTAAERCARFIRGNLVGEKGRLMRTYHLGRASVPGFLEDYAAYIWGLVTLHEVTGRGEFLDLSLSLCQDMMRLFGKGEQGMLFDSGNDSEEILMRVSSTYDGVVPSGNSMAALVLCKLGRIMGDDRLVDAARGIVHAVLAKEGQQPVSLLALLMARELLEGDGVVATFSGPLDAPAARSMMLALHQTFIPDLVVRHAGLGDAEYPAVAGGPAVYVCAGGACRPPVTTSSELSKLLHSLP